RNELVEGRAVPTEERETIRCGIVFRSVGYRGVALPGVLFDEGSGTIPNEGGRVSAGVYVAGWIKRGPSGVIGTNKKDAMETVALLLADARAGLLPRAGEVGTLEALLADRGVEAVVYPGWEAIDALERGRGEPHGRPRIKLLSWEELLAAARG
ncbi:MAG: NADP oxidoreductase, partial [Gaiellaceae bacterium]